MIVCRKTFDDITSLKDECLTCEYVRYCRQKTHENIKRESIKLFCRKTGQPMQITEYCESCIEYMRCSSNLIDADEKFKLIVPRDAIINDWGNGRIEAVIYDDSFRWLADHNKLEQRIQRNFIVYEDEKEGKLLIPKNDKVRFQNLIETLNRGSRYAQDAFYGYAFANDWTFFFTFTFDRAKVNRYDDDEITACWITFRKRLQYFDKNVKILCVRERHQDGALHFHGLIHTEKTFEILYPDNFGNVTGKKKDKHKIYLTFHYEKGKPKLNKLSDPLFEFDFWDYGRHTLAILPKDKSYDAAINYLINYTTKEGNVGFQQKRFFRTRNLNAKTKIVTNKADAETIVIEGGLKFYKSGNGFKVYRNFNIKD